MFPSCVPSRQPVLLCILHRLPALPMQAFFRIASLYTHHMPAVPAREQPQTNQTGLLPHAAGTWRCEALPTCVFRAGARLRPARHILLHLCSLLALHMDP